jgi:glycosyltransferase involved in cell wall biosynthesis
VRLCYVGTLASWQGLEDVLRVLPRLTTPWQLTVVTGAPPRAQRRLRRKAARLGMADRVSVRDAVAPHELLDLLRSQDVGLVPLTPCERNLVQGCMPIKLLDLLAAGLPVLAPDLPVVRQVVGDDYPLYRRARQDDLLATLERLTRDAGVRRGLGVAGIARVASRFSADAHREALLAVYDELLGGR